MKRLNLIVLSFIFMASSLFADDLPQINFKSLNDPIPIDKSIKIGKFSNGMTYYIKQNSKPEKRAELRLVTLAASIQEDEDQKGLAHFVEHMCFNGTKDFPKNKLIDFLEKTGIRFGADLNANTGFDRTLYLLQVPTDDKAIKESGVHVLEQWAHEVSFEPEEIDKERGVIMEEWRLGKGANDRIMKEQLPKLFHNSRYADRLPIGDTAVIMNAPYEAFTRYYKDWYRPDLQAIIAVGDFDVDEMEKLLKKYFESIPARKNPRKHFTAEIPPHKEIIAAVNTDKEMPMVSVNFYFKLPLGPEGTFAAYKDGIIESLVNQMLIERLVEKTRSANPPFLQAYAMKMDRALGEIGLFMVIGILKNDNIEGGYNAVISEAFRAYKHGFTETEFDRAKKEMMRSMEQTYNERDKMPSGGFANEYVRNFQFGEGIPGIAYEYALYQKFIPEISINDVNTTIKQYIDDGSLVITMSGPEKDDLKMPSEKWMIDEYNKVKTSDLEAYVDKVSADPLFDKEVTPGTIKGEKKFPNLYDTYELTLSNGAKVILMPTDFKNDEILFSATSPGGHSLASDKDYLSASMADGIVMEAGVSKFDATSLQKLLAGKVANVRPYIGELSEGFNGSTTPSDMETFFQLLYLNFTEPRLDYEAYETYHSRLKEQVLNSQVDPMNAFRDTFNVVFSNYHPRRMPLTEKLLDAMDPDVAYEFYKNRFADASDFTFMFVGAFKMEEIKPLIEKYIASLPSMNRKETWKDLGIKTPKGEVEKIVKKGVEPKSTVLFAMNGDFKYDKENRFEVQALIDVFNIKLREALREDKGGVYGVRAFQRLNKYPKGTYSIQIYFGCNPDRAQELIETCKGIMNEMKETEPSQIYMDKITETMKRQWEVNLKENRFWLRSFDSYIENDEDIDKITYYLPMVAQLKAADIKKAANKYFSTNNIVEVVLMPEN